MPEAKRFKQRKSKRKVLAHHAMLVLKRGVLSLPASLTLCTGARKGTVGAKAPRREIKSGGGGRGGGRGGKAPFGGIL